MHRSAAIAPRINRRRGFEPERRVRRRRGDTAVPRCRVVADARSTRNDVNVSFLAQRIRNAATAAECGLRARSDFDVGRERDHLNQVPGFRRLLRGEGRSRLEERGTEYQQKRKCACRFHARMVAD